MDEELGQNTMLSHYRIISKIGNGGMGEVYLAEDTNLERKVAIKFLKAEYSQDLDKLTRFVQEAKAASALNHPHILTVFEIGKVDDKNFIATEFIEGETLREYQSAQESFGLRDILKIGIQVSEGLVAAHQAGIIHRDIKPENIMIREDGYSKILDFGLAKLTEKNSQKISSESKTKPLVQTLPGTVMGTVSYMSPEQARGNETDAQTDIWSVGVVLYEMLSGKPPFPGETFNHIIVAILEQEPLALNNVPAELQRIVRKALTKDKEMRYQSVKDLLIDLKNLRRSLDVQGELERSGSQNELVGTESFSENTTRLNPGRSIEETNADGYGKARTTVRITDGGRSIYWKAALSLFLVSTIGTALWWFSGVRTNEGSPTGLLKSVGITSWSSGPNETIVETSFSPDAKMVAFGSARSGATEIWFKPVAGGEPIQVTKNGFYNQFPVWSPTGQEIAYFSNRGNKGGIWRASFTGGEQTEIVGDVDFRAKPRLWSKSGKIYFQRGFDLFSVDDKSSEVKAITNFKSKGLEPRTIEVTADESLIAFAVKENELYKVKVARIGSDKMDEIAVSKDQIDYLAWHPNNRDVIYSATVEGNYQIFQAPIEGGNPVQLSSGDLDFFVEDVSSDGNQILYWSQNETSDLWIVSIQDRQEAIIADETSAEYWASVSPDGNAVAYQSVTKANRPFSGAILSRSIKEPGSPLTLAANGFSPVWSKNGEWIVFFRRSEKDIEIWRVGSNGGDLKRLSSGGIQPPSYASTPYLKIGMNQLIHSPNADLMAYAASRDSISNIWLVSRDGSIDKPITDNKDEKETLCCPAWTLDGKHFVVSSRYSGQEPVNKLPNRLWRYSTDEQGKKLIFESREQIRFLGIENDGENAVVAIIPDSAVSTPTPDVININLVSLDTGKNLKVNTLNNAYSHNIHLSPDGKSIAYVSRRQNISEIWIVPVSGGEPQKLITDNDPKVFISSLSWSPNGKSIVFGRQSQNSLLSMLVR